MQQNITPSCIDFHAFIILITALTNELSEFPYDKQIELICELLPRFWTAGDDPHNDGFSKSLSIWPWTDSRDPNSPHQILETPLLGRFSAKVQTVIHTPLLVDKDEDDA
eukprot:Gb_04475 [translate_table: standard]